MTNRKKFPTLEEACNHLGVDCSSIQHRDGSQFIRANVGDSPSGKGDASIRFFPDGGGGFIRNWQTGEDALFFNNYSLGVRMSASEWEEKQAQIQESRRVNSIMLEKRQEAVAKLAESIMSAAQPSTKHSYLCCKHVLGFLGAPSLEINRDDAQEIIDQTSIPFPDGKPQSLWYLEQRLLCIPIVDVDGKLWTLQLIDANGKKSFLKGGKVTSNMWLPEGFQFGGNTTVPIGICEGVATALSVQKMYGIACVAAISASNLSPVAEAIEKKIPQAELWFFADRDDSGVGEKRAREAASRITHSRLYVCPELTSSELTTFSALTGKDKASDFNDLMIARWPGSTKSNQSQNLFYKDL